MSNYDGRLTGLLYANEDIEVYIGRDQSVKIFDGMADNIVTSPDGLKFKAYDNLGLLQQEYIIEEYQSEWRDTDVGVIIRAIVEDSKWGVTGKYVRTDTGVTVGRVNYRWKSRLAAIRSLVGLANTGSKKYVVFCDGDGYIHFRRYDDDTWPVAFMTTEDDMRHSIEDLIDHHTRLLLFMDENEDPSNLAPQDYTHYNQTITAVGTDLRVSASEWKTKNFSRRLNANSDTFFLVTESNDLDLGTQFTIDCQFYLTSHQVLPDSSVLIHHKNDDFKLKLLSTGQITVRILGSGGTFIGTTTDGHIFADNWYYISVVAESGGDIHVYVNGTLVETLDGSAKVPWTIGYGTSNDKWTIGGQYVNDTTIKNEVDGYIDLVRFSSGVVRGATEIANYTRIQSSDMLLTDISKQEMGGEKYNHCIVKYSDDVWAQYPDPMPDNPVTKMITTTDERTDHDCYLRAKAVVLTHREVPTRYKATAYTSRCDYRPNDLVEIYSPRYGIVGNFRLKNLTYTIHDNIRKMSMTLGEEREELTTLLAIAGL